MMPKFGETAAIVQRTDYLAKYITRKIRKMVSVQKTMVPVEWVRDIIPAIP